MNAQSPQPPQGNPKPQQQQPQQKAEPDKSASTDQGSGPEQPQSDVIGGTAAYPLGEEALPGAAAAASRIYRSTVSSHGSGTLISSGSVQTMNFYGGQAAERLLAGPLPEDELRRLRRVFQEPKDYGEYRGQLRGGQLLVLLGRPGTGRSYTALSLLDDLTRGQVSRLDPRTDLDKLDDNQINEGHGYVLEPSAVGLPDETGLDRLCELLRKKQAYAVLLATPEPGDVLSRGGRYYRVHTPAPRPPYSKVTSPTNSTRRGPRRTSGPGPWRSIPRWWRRGASTSCGRRRRLASRPCWPATPGASSRTTNCSPHAGSSPRARPPSGSPEASARKPPSGYGTRPTGSPSPSWTGPRSAPSPRPPRCSPGNWPSP